MKLDVSSMRYLSKDDFRVLTAVEMGMKNHELVPVELIISIARLRNGGAHKILSTLLRHKLIAHNSQQYDGYRLSYLGFDILALKTLLSRGVIASVGSQIGIGKESDIFEAQNAEGEDLVIKVHRLGRTSFRAVRKQRDYMKGKTKASWLFMSRLAAIKEFAFMKALYEHGFSTPVPFDQNRHIVAMSRISGFPMAQIKTGQMEGAEAIFGVCISMLKRLAEHGLVHCDFNEFNLMTNNEGNVTMIDFPQMVSTNHPNAIDLFQRDVNGLVKFFAMKMRYVPPEYLIPKLEDISSTDERLDDEIRACGKFTKEDDEELIRFINFENDLQSAQTIQGISAGCKDDDEEDDEEIEEEVGIKNVGFNEGVFGAPQHGQMRPNHNTATYDHDFNIEDHASSRGGGGSRLNMRVDKRGVTEPEELDLTAASLHAQQGTSMDNDGLDLDETHSDEDTYEELDESGANSQPVDIRQVKENLKKDKLKKQEKTGRPNQTKGRTKYGKIDRSGRVDFW